MSHLGMMSKQPLSVSFRTVRLTHTYFVNRKEKKSHSCRRSRLRSAGVKGTEHHSIQATQQLLHLCSHLAHPKLWLLFFLILVFSPPLEGYCLCRPLISSQKKGLYNTKRENQSWKKGHTIAGREACLVQLDLLWLQEVILPFQTAVYLKIK